MKNVLLSVVVVGVLIAGGLSGTFAHFSDTEEVFDNYVASGSLDLMVSDTFGNEYQQLPWGTGIPALFVQEDVVPGKDVSMHFDLHNAGQVAKGTPYMHFKNVRCVDIEPDKYAIWVLDGKKVDEGTTGAVPKTEPEAVAEFGGWIGQIEVAGIKDIECFLSQYIEVERITVTDKEGDEYDVPLPDAWDTNDNGMFEMSELVCHNIRLLPLVQIIDPNDPNKVILNYIPACNTIEVDVDFFIHDIDEDDLVPDIIPAYDNDGDGLYDEDDFDWQADGKTPADPQLDNDDDGYINEDPVGYFLDEMELCWDAWPTNALQKDKMLFDMLFSLVQYDP